ncbi:MAG: hypothetical protein ACFFAO_00945 [Candidatus Hermodarchaeota archaeon]
MPKKKQKASEKENRLEKSDKKDKEHYIYAKVSDDTREIIDRIKDQGKTISYIIGSAVDIYDIYNSMPQELKDFVEEARFEYGGRRNVIKEAVKVLESRKNREKADDLDLWYRAKNEMNMMLLKKKSFLELISAAENNINRLSDKNLALDIILWYVGKPLKELTLNQLLNAIKRIWTVFNYFSLIDIKKESEEEYYITLNHYQNKKYSDYWLSYTRDLLQSDSFSFTCKVEGEAYEETLSIKVKKVFSS